MEEEAEQLTPFAQTLSWIGYDEAQARVLEQEFGDLPTMGSATRTEITDVLKTYAQRTVGAGRIISGLVRTKRMQGLAHWVRDFNELEKRRASMVTMRSPFSKRYLLLLKGLLQERQTSRQRKLVRRKHHRGSYLTKRTGKSGRQS